MHLHHGSAMGQSTDRREEFVGTVATVLPYAASALESVAMYIAVAAFWGAIAFLAMNVIGA